jgi:integrase/recombinase XerD
VSAVNALNEVNKNYLIEFQEFLIVERNLSQNSIIAYTQDLKKFFYYVESKNLDILKITTEELVNFLNDDLQKNISKRSLARLIASLKQFYYFLQIKNYINKNPAQKIEQPKIEKNLPDYLTLEEINQFFNIFDINNIFELRDRCIFEIMYVSGLRISEVCNLKLSDIDLQEMEIKVLGKGNKARITPFGEKTLNIIKLYLTNSRSYISKHKAQKNEYLFISKKGGKLDRKSVWKFLQKYARRAGIVRSISPHTFRHSCATHMIQNNADIRIVQEILGHSDISTTQIYTHIDKKHLKEAHKKYHPRG